MKHYWESYIDKINQLQSFADMVALATEVLDSLPGDIAMVSGPISTGGLGSREANLKNLDETVQRLLQEGHTIFDQTPLDGKMNDFVSHIINGYPMPILEEFYLPIFQSGKIKKLFFIKGYESSFGASWEHDRGNELGIKIIYL